MSKSSPAATGTASSTLTPLTTNFIAKLEIDEGTTDLSLEVTEYDTAPDADYQSWLLLEPEAAEA